MAYFSFLKCKEERVLKSFEEDEGVFEGGGGRFERKKRRKRWY